MLANTLPKKRATHVKTTKEEHENLEVGYGEGVRDWCYQNLSEWKRATPKNRWHDSDYNSIIRWVVSVYYDREVKNPRRELWKDYFESHSIGALGAGNAN